MIKLNLNLDGMSNKIRRVCLNRTRQVTAPSENVVNRSKPETSMNIVDGSPKNLFRKIANLLGVRTKLNPWSFSTFNQPVEPLVRQSKEARMLAEHYLNNGYISHNEKIVDGFKDFGKYAHIDENNNFINVKREIITIDRNKDPYLRNAINYTKEHTKNLNDKEKAKFIFNLIRDIGGKAEQSLINSKDIAKTFKGKELLLGTSFELQATTSEHKALMFKILADEVGLPSKLKRGILLGLSPAKPYAWNKVYLSHDKELFIDTQRNLFLDVESSNAIKQFKKARCFFDY